MAIVQLISKNPNLSFIIRKNPESGMSLRSIRKGISYGWYTEASTYNVYFKDAENEISYKQFDSEQFEYLNVSRFNTPLFPLNAISEFFSSPIKAKHELDIDGFQNQFTVNMIHIELLRYIEFFEKHLQDFKFDIKHLAHKSYTLTISTDKSIYQLLHVVSVLCLFLSMFGNEYIDISEDVLGKYINSLNVIDAPFYIRSLFVRNFLSSKDRFRKYKAEIEKTDRYQISFKFGHTGLQRRNYIQAILPFDKSILDIGCGEGFYALSFSKKTDSLYYAIDIDEELLESVKHKAVSRDIDNLVGFSSIDQFLEDYNGEIVDVILTEVIEHMSKAEAKDIITKICENVEFDNFIITTPNSDFNQFYELEGFRHHDHKWEMGQEEFNQWFLDVVKDTPLDCEFVSLGDGVNNISTTQGAILKRKGA